MMMLAWVALSLVSLSVAALLYLYRRPLPRIDGTVPMSGLRAPVEIIRDRWGVPHISWDYKLLNLGRDYDL